VNQFHAAHTPNNDWTIAKINSQYWRCWPVMIRVVSATASWLFNG